MQDVHSREFPSTAVLDLMRLRNMCVHQRSGQCPRSIYVRILGPLSGPLRFA